MPDTDHLANLSLEVRLTELLFEQDVPMSMEKALDQRTARLELLLSAAKGMVAHLNRPRDPADRAIVRPLFVSDEEWGPIVEMVERGIADAEDYATYVERHPSAEDEPDEYAARLRRTAKRADTALTLIRGRSAGR